jgi:ATP-dependent DNA helicase RecG
VEFQKLSYVVIDEQHRFGVEQREKLTEYTSHLQHDKIETEQKIEKGIVGSDNL